MLSGVKLVPKEEAERAEEEDRRHHRKEHKSKKEKKEKRKKHKKERRERRRSGSPSPSSGSEGERPGHGAAAAPAAPAAPAPVAAAAAAAGPQREDWMTVPMGRSLAAAPEPKKEEAEASDAPRISDRELNPHLRGGGDGVAPAPAAAAAAAAPPAAAPGIGDGGASWRLKALRRAQVQAAGEGRALGDVVSERWGSLGDLTAELTERAAAHDMAHARAARERRGGGGREGRGGDHGGGGGGGARYLSDVRSTKNQMRRPSEQNLERMSWRRDRSGSRGGSASEGGRPPSGAEAVLRAAAPALNAFSNDGSFMNQFAGRQGREEGEEEGDREEAAPAPAAERPPAPPRRERREEEEEGEEEARSRERGRASARGEDREAPGGANLSAAAALRARLGGRPAPAAPSRPLEETVALPLVDARGRAAPGAFGREGAGAATAAVGGASGRPPKRTERFEGGERKRYFADDDAVDLDTLVKRTRYGDTDDLDATMAGNIARRSRFKETDLDADAEYDYDGGLDLAEGGRGASKEARRRGGAAAAAEAAARDKARQVREFSRFQSALDRCGLCFTSAARPKHLTLAIGTAAYLALPPRGRLLPGHCQIIPVDHVGTTRTADEATWTEIRNFKKALLQMFAAQGLGVVFLETAAAAAGAARAHAVVDAIPLPLDAFDKAPMYFKKAVDDATEDWAQHAAKRMIDTSKKGLRGAVPPNFPYLHVEFGLAAGFVHVIDNPAEFDRGLGRGVLVGLLGLPAEDAHRRARRESEAIQAQWAAEFRAQFDEYDWTKQL